MVCLELKDRVFHMIEDPRLRTAQRLADLISVICMLSRRIFWMTMLDRAAADATLDLKAARDN